MMKLLKLLERGFFFMRSVVHILGLYIAVLPVVNLVTLVVIDDASNDGCSCEISDKGPTQFTVKLLGSEMIPCFKAWGVV